jgi:hypothetical protein
MNLIVSYKTKNVVYDAFCLTNMLIISWQEIAEGFQTFEGFDDVKDKHKSIEEVYKLLDSNESEPTK